MRKLCLVVVLVAACGGKKDPAPEAKKENPTATSDAGTKVVAGSTDAGAKVVAAKDGGAAAAKRAPMVTRAQVDALMAAWLAAQNEGKFDVYEQLYADDFKGVRRSGKQTKRLDRKGWLKERKNMFKNPMLVATQDVEVTLGQGHASVRFTQEWSSGKYHDVGPKVIEAIADANALKISREELLISRIVKPAKPLDPDETLPVYPMIEDRVVISSDVDPDWAKGDPKLLDGSIPERDPSCDDDPPDYEEDNNRYFECESTDPDSGHGEFSASQGVDLAALPKYLSAWVGQKVRVTGENGAGCEATIDRLELYAAAESTYGEVTTAGSADEDVAGEVLDGHAVLTATLIGGCKGTWAQPASAAAVAPWKREPAPPAITKAVIESFKDVGRDEYDLADLQVDVLVSPDGKHRLVIAERGGEECFGISPFFAVLALKGDDLGDVLLEDPDRWLRAAVDTDGDGWPELVLDDGISVWDAEGETYDHRVMMDFPDTVMEECGE